jgi:pyridoxine 5-phosphate synthase
MICITAFPLNLPRQYGTYAIMPAKLSVNINAIAYLRNRRALPWPSLINLGRIALEAGAHGLTVHPRPDERHIRFSDLGPIRALLDDEFPQAEFNMEGYPTEDFLALVEKYQPSQATLVPDDPSQPTSDHGWDFIKHQKLLTPIVSRLKSAGVRVSLFADPDPLGLEVAKETGADRVEFYTGPYGSNHTDRKAAKPELARLSEAALKAKSLGLAVNAGHDLTAANLPALAKAIPHLAEVSIGHALTADALEFGMAETVKRFLAALE